MIVPRDLTSIDDTVLLIDIESVDVEYTFKREFSWYVSSYNSTNCTIQFVWESPPWISSTTVRDKLSLSIIDREKFITPRRRLQAVNSDQISSTSIQFEIEIPP